jgi:acyl-CoA thioesterase-1
VWLLRRHFNLRALVAVCSLCNGLLTAHAQAPSAPAGATKSAPSPQTTQRLVLVVGDSLSAEYGLKRGTGWVTLLQAKLQTERPGTVLVNASISGDTTSGGRTRLPALLRQHKPTVVIIELGGNDALRGLDLPHTQDNLALMVRAAKAAGATVLLLGMDMPPNYGEQYAKAFRDLYPQVAKAERVALVPFFLAGVADVPDALQWFQADRIHPNERAQPTMLVNVWPSLAKLIR